MIDLAKAKTLFTEAQCTAYSEPCQLVDASVGELRETGLALVAEVERYRYPYLANMEKALERIEQLCEDAEGVMWEETMGEIYRIAAQARAGSWSPE